MDMFFKLKEVRQRLRGAMKDHASVHAYPDIDVAVSVVTPRDLQVMLDAYDRLEEVSIQILDSHASQSGEQWYQDLHDVVYGDTDG